MQMSLRLQIAFLTMACCVFAGCRMVPPITREDLVGSYVYKSEDPANKTADHEWDRLTVQANGKYDLVQGGPTKPKTETTGTWTLIHWSSAAHGPEILLGAAGYPIQTKGSEVRLLIDEDTGIWYVKVK